MININLLPESMRKKESMPIQQFLGILVGLGVLGVMVWMITKYKFDTIPSMTREVLSLEQNKKVLQAQQEELKAINAEINRMSGYVDAVKSLYMQRVVWAKIMSDVKHIINFDPSMEKYNPEMRYLWATSFTGQGKNISMRFFATAGTQVQAMQMPELLLQRFRSYTLTSLPEKDEEARLEAELKKATDSHEKERQDNPDLPLQGPEELKIRQRLEEIKAFKSGGIALIPFDALLVPGSLQFKSVSWGAAPRPTGRRENLLEVFPTMAWSFDVSATLK